MKKLVFVVGMHRSGTSCIAQSLAHMGLSFGNDLLPNQDDNPLGFFESAWVVHFHDRLLRSFDRRWDDLRPFPEGWVDAPASRAAQDELQEWLVGPSVPQVIKDPRLCRTLPLWLPVLKAGGFAPPFVLGVARNPADVIASLQSRNGLAPAAGELLWLRHMIELESHTRDIPRRWLSYPDGYLDSDAGHSGEVIAALAEFLSTTLDAAGFRAIFQPDQNHASAIAVGNTPFYEEAKTIWQAMQVGDESHIRDACAIAGERLLELDLTGAALLAQLGERCHEMENVHRELGISVEQNIALLKRQEEMEAQLQRAKNPALLAEAEYFVRRAYSLLLRREVDPGGLITYVAMMQEQGLGAMLQDLWKSGEARALWDNACAIDRDVELLVTLPAVAVDVIADDLIPASCDSGQYWRRGAEYRYHRSAEDSCFVIDLPMALPKGSYILHYSLRSRCQGVSQARLWVGNDLFRAISTCAGKNQILFRIDAEFTPLLRLDPAPHLDEFDFTFLGLGKVTQLDTLQQLRHAHRGELPEGLLRDWSESAEQCPFPEAFDRAVQVQEQLGQYLEVQRDYIRYIVGPELRWQNTLDHWWEQNQQWEKLPLFSLIMPVYQSHFPFLDAAIQSVLEQRYPRLQLILVDDASATPNMHEHLLRWKARDTRIEVAVRHNNGGISAASNTGLELARGDWLGFVDHDDLLAPYALLALAKVIMETPQAKIVYSDEDHLSLGGLRLDPHFKAPRHFKWVT